jgi:sporulation protein YlmC with PRC-barrel domain
MAGTAAKELRVAAALQLARVVTDDGLVLGHLFDLRCEWHDNEPRARITHLIYGRRGLLERLGFRKRFVTIPWKAVIEIGERQILVRGAGIRR